MSWRLTQHCISHTIMLYHRMEVANEYHTKDTNIHRLNKQHGKEPFQNGGKLSISSCCGFDLSP
jgi:hypothetical protein